MGATERLDDFQQRHRWAGAPLAVIYKFHDDQGVYLAALIAFYGFLSVFPLLLLLTSILGFVLQNDPELQTRVLDSTLSQFPVIGQQLGDPQSVRGSGIALVVSVLVAVYGALGVAHAIQHAMNVTWAVPRCRRPNPFHLRLRSLVLIALGGLATMVATVLSGFASSAAAFGANLDWLTAVLIVVAAIVVNAAVFVVGFWICVARSRSVRSLLPGALTAAVVWQVLQLVGTAYVSRVVTNADATYGAFALVLGLIAWIFLASVAIVFSAEIDVVRYKRLYPRSLLTPFTDDVELTRADRRTYTEIAAAQQYKEFETVTVSFADERHGVASSRQRDAVEGGPGVQSPAREWKPRTPPSAPSNWSP
jgi:membrane protein